MDLNQLRMSPGDLMVCETEGERAEREGETASKPACVPLNAVTSKK